MNVGPHLGSPGRQAELVEQMNEKLVRRKRCRTELQQLDIAVVHLAAAPEQDPFNFSV
jgi:hypothetical protein